MTAATVRILGCMLLLHLFSYSAAAQISQGTIDAVVIEGNRFVTEDKIRRIIRLNPGDRFEPQRITEALKRLYATKEFSDVQAFQQDRNGRVLLTIVVKEHIYIEEVRFEGNKKIDEKDLAEAISIRAGTFVRPSLLRRDFATIEEMYKEKGYYRVDVSNEISREEDKKKQRNVTFLTFKVEEGEKIKIRHIDIFGNRTLDSDVIKKGMKSQEDGWLSGGEFKPKVLERDVTAIDSLYRAHGFLDAEVVKQELFFSEDGKGLDIFLTVYEGRQYKAGKLRFEGNELFPDAIIQRQITMEYGDVFDDTEFSMIQARISEMYWDRGYIYSSVSPNKTIDRERIDVDFVITEGEPARINEITISGNTKTHEKVIRRELMVRPGDVFLRPRLIRSLREVFSLGFFEAPPEVGTTQANADGDINLDLKVTEKQTGQFRLGAGFSALNSISGFIGLAETNFLGRGLLVGIDWEFSRYRNNVDLRFTEPWFLNTPTELHINAFNRQQNQVRQQFYDDRRRGLTFRIGRPFPWFDYTSAFVRYRVEDIELSNFSPLYVGPLRDTPWPQTTSSLAFTLVRNSTDSPFRPTTGTRTTGTAEFNGGPLGGDVEFQRFEAGIQWYARLFSKFVLEIRYQAGLLESSAIGGVPDYELFRLGGNRQYGVRGYDFFEIVPQGNPLFIGGKFFHTLAYEVTFPLAPNVFLLGFVDNGNTWNSFRGADMFDFRKGAGIGIRLEMPMLGRIGFDYGYGFDKVLGAGWEPHIFFGAGF